MIAMALMCDPELLVADEPTTALDVSRQAQILWLLASLKRELGSRSCGSRMTSASWRVADRVSVMDAGEVVERATTAQLFRRATASLYARPAVVRARRQERCDATGRSARSPAHADHRAGVCGCAFRSRCAHAIDAARTDPAPPGRRRA